MTGDACDGARDGLENIMQVAGDGIGGLSGRPACEFQSALTAGGRLISGEAPVDVHEQ